MPKADPPIRDSFRKLYPDLSEEELRMAHENFKAYVALTLRIYEAIRRDPERYAGLREMLVPKRIQRKLERDAGQDGGSIPLKS